MKKFNSMLYWRWLEFIDSGLIWVFLPAIVIGLLYLVNENAYRIAIAIGAGLGPVAAVWVIKSARNCKCEKCLRAKNGKA